MSKTVIKNGDMHWEVLIDDMNCKNIKPYDVLAYREEFVKKLKKSGISKEVFEEKLMREMQYHFWSRCEYEMLIGKNSDGTIFLTHLIGDTDDQFIVTKETGINWDIFLEKLKDTRLSYDGLTKFDIYDQLMFRKQEFIDYCWNFKHKYWRQHKNNN